MIEYLFHMKLNTESDSSIHILSDYFLTHRNLETLTLKKVMQDTALSKSTVARFFPLLGVDNFTQFINEYGEEIKNRKRRERLILNDQEYTGKQDYLDEQGKLFIKEIAKQSSHKSKLIFVGEMKDVLLIEPFLPHFYDLGFDCDIVWDFLVTSEYRICEDAFYLMVFGHFTISEYQIKGNRALAYAIRTILNATEDIALISYMDQSNPVKLHLDLSRKLKPVEKKLYLLALFGELHNEILHVRGS